MFLFMFEDVFPYANNITVERKLAWTIPWR